MSAGTLAALTIALFGAGPAAARTVDPQAHADARDALQRVRQARDGELSGQDVTLALRELAASTDDLGPQDRAAAERLLARPTDSGGDGILDYGSAASKMTCDTRFCVHWVTTGDDAPDLTDAQDAAGAAGTNGVPDFVDAMLREFEVVYATENSSLGWRVPVGDGSEGGSTATGTGTSAQLDIYVGNIGAQGYYGYAAAENVSTRHAATYMVMDDDYAEFGYPVAERLLPLRVTAAHEYNHVLQYATDAWFDPWFAEATATWMEDQVYPEVNDWLNYVAPWATIPAYPLTTYSPDASGANGVKVYGTSLFVHWLTDRGALGVDGVRTTWEAMAGVSPADNAVAALDSRLALATPATSTSDQFGAFTAASAEWRSANSGFHDRDLYSVAGIGDVGRSTLPASGSTATISHLGYQLYDVPRTGSATTLTVTAPAGVRTSIALVGRTGDLDGGTTTITRTAFTGGSGSVTLAAPATFSRVTAVVANADTRATLSGSPSAVPHTWSYPGDGKAFSIAVGPSTGTAATPTTTTPPTFSPATTPPGTPPSTTPTTTTTAASPTPTTTTPATTPAGTAASQPATTPAGGAITTTPKTTAPSASSVVAALRTTRSTIATRLRSHGVARLRAGLTGLAFGAPGAGRLTVTVTSGGRAVATGTARSTGASRVRFSVRTTAAGRRLLKGRSRRRVTLVLRFAPASGSAQTIRQTLTIRP